jgi:hypothetical protein
MENSIEKWMKELYSCYETEISLQNIRYIHPMFYNGTFCENNCYQPPEPDKLITRDEFVEKLWSETEEGRWRTSFQVLYNYISKHFSN